MSDPILARDLLNIIGELERRLVALERSPQLASAGIRDGALTIYDNNAKPIIVLGKQADGKYGLVVNDTSGVAQLRLGQLAAGGYGGEVLDPVTGTQVKLATLAYGIQAAVVTAVEGTTSTVFTDLATVGPAVTVTIGASGRAIVHLACLQDISLGGQVGRMGFAVSGASTVAASASAAVATTSDPGEGHGSTFLVTGLNPGVHTFTAKYRSSNVGNVAQFAERTIVVQPF